MILHLYIYFDLKGKAMLARDASEMKDLDTNFYQNQIISNPSPAEPGYTLTLQTV